MVHLIPRWREGQGGGGGEKPRRHIAPRPPPPAIPTVLWWLRRGPWRELEISRVPHRGLLMVGVKTEFDLRLGWANNQISAEHHRRARARFHLPCFHQRLLFQLPGE
ncbi:hypothetical protein BRADI_3g42485v3 [Brachypodium distachyon]|uniref:Uncharacterized protein n=1 Tax=Brachypodium distachyon TaxID=15368 RepID=A0A2K2D2Q2_BRADI|nr:hypothetical protein BRADI_3g42485v3 [Brachypodium distachyon]